MLQMRPGCECCDRDLPPDAADARICSFECTFCAACADALASIRPEGRDRLRILGAQDGPAAPAARAALDSPAVPHELRSALDPHLATALERTR